MTYFITDLSRYANDILSCSLEASIHSIYKKTLNIHIGESILALQVKHSPVSPLSLITDMDEYALTSLHIHVGENVKILPNQIQISNYHFHISPQTKCYDLSLSIIPTTSALMLIQSAVLYSKQILEKCPPFGFNKILHTSCPLDLLTSHAASLFAALQEKGILLSHLYLPKLIGVGEGLTPSGDDFICGFLSALYVFQPILPNGYYPKLCESLLQALHKTNSISRGFLHFSIQGQASMAVKTFFDSLCSDILCEQLDSMQTSFLAIGHSSGIDSLTGIYMATTLLISYLS